MLAAILRRSQQGKRADLLPIVDLAWWVKKNARRRKTVLSIIMFIVGLLSAIIGVVVFGLSGHKTKTEKLSEITMYVGVVLILLSVALK
ncbi:hypothetical protein [Escherichia phage UPWr_E1]